MNKVFKQAIAMSLAFVMLLGLVITGLPAYAEDSVGEATRQSEEVQPITLVAGNSVWKYLDDGTDQNTVWRSVYDDSTWQSGQAPLGYKDNGTGVSSDQFGALKTNISYGADKSKKYPTSYFRTNVTLNKEEVMNSDKILGNFAFDDGVVLYLNGVEIYREAMPTGEINYHTLSTTNGSNPNEYTKVNLTEIVKANLKDGNNEISAEVHQSRGNSSDLYWDMSLIAYPTAEKESIQKVTVTFHGDPVSAKGFTWYTTLKSTGNDLQVVEYTSTTPDFTKASEFTGRAAVSRNSKEELVHKAEANNLKADTKYYFRVGDKALDLWSEVGTFETAAKTGAFTFIDLADTQAKTQDEAILSGETMAKALTTFPNAKFVAINGDIVDTGTNESQWNWLLGHSQETLLNTTIVPVAGNHEDEANAFYEHYNIQEAAGSSTETGAYYSYDYSNAHFVVLNTNENSDEFANFSKAQLDWMEADVKAAKAAGAQWIIVALHKGPYTTSNHATDKDIMGANGERAKVAPMMAELGIDLVLQGHDHIYARTKPIKADGTAADTVKITESFNGQTVEYTVNPDGTIYLIPATAGAKVYYKNMKPELGEAYYNLFEVANENTAAKYGADPSDSSRPKRGQVQTFVGITVDAGKLTALSYEIDQNVNDAKPYVLEEFGIIKETDTGGVTPTPEPTPAPTTAPTAASTVAPTTAPTAAPTVAPTTAPTAAPTVAPTTAPTAAPTVAPTTAPTTMPTTAPTTAPTTVPSPTATPVIKPVLTDTGSHWASSAIQKAVEAGFVNGYTDNTFRPNKEVNRVEFITMLSRALHLPDNGTSSSFKDSGQIPVWANSYVAQAVSLGIISGYDDGTFRPTQELTRSELAVMIVRALGITVDTKATLSFKDAKDVPAWAVPYIAAAVEEGLVNGVGQNRFAPNQKASRAEAITLILGLLEKKGM